MSAEVWNCMRIQISYWGQGEEKWQSSTLLKRKSNLSWDINFAKRLMFLSRIQHPILRTKESTKCNNQLFLMQRKEMLFLNKTENQFSPRPRVKRFQDLSKLLETFLYEFSRLFKTFQNIQRPFQEFNNLSF